MAVQPEGSVHEGICVWEHGGDRMALAWVHVQPAREGEQNEGISLGIGGGGKREPNALGVLPHGLESVVQVLPL